MADEFIGSGWAFPGHANQIGGVARVAGRRELEEAMRIILSTAPGERPMRPEFGCGIHGFVFDRADETTAGMVSHEVLTALERWEPRVDVLAVDVEFDTAQPGVLYLDITYRSRSTNDTRNLVFPFYAIPEREGEEAGPTESGVEVGREGVPA